MEDSLLFNSPGYPILSFIMLMPLIGALVCHVLRGNLALKIWGLIVTGLTALMSMPLYVLFDRTSARYQFAEVRAWIPALDLNYVVGVDGISVLLVLLTTLMMPLCVLCSWHFIRERLAEFIIVLLLMETAMIGVFVSLNTVLFYIFWEGMLVPMYLLIAVWGGPRKDYASIKFFLYTLVGSVFLLLALIVLYVQTDTFFIPELMSADLTFPLQMLIFIACAVAFVIKIPLYPFHTWLPAAHVEAPTAGSVILASLLLKMGCYGFLRLALPIAPEAAQFCAPVMIGLALVSIVFGGCLALAQTDIKRLIAYSSVAHMGFVTLGIFVFSTRGIKGALLEMINHGVITGALFIGVGMLYERTGSREIRNNSGLSMLMPVFVAFMALFGLAALGFPGTSGFVGEFLIMIAAFEQHQTVGLLLIPGVVLAAAYMLRLLQKLIWADCDGIYCLPVHAGDGFYVTVSDLSIREWCLMAVLAVPVLWVGLYPAPLLEIMSCSVDSLLQYLPHAP
ncbi:MAG: NADH-quinone oxidoreductase subunit M [Deltaproteobacteria bacterium]|nr:NADH-quinone oxidoreductase subunit M [Deltaproteobacteria bacterium]